MNTTIEKELAETVKHYYVVNETKKNATAEAKELGGEIKDLMAEAEIVSFEVDGITAMLTAKLGTYEKTVTVNVTAGTETGTSFEYGISSAFTSSSNTSLRQTSEHATNGSKALALDAGNTYWPRLYIAETFLAKIFEDSSINTFYFDVHNGGLQDHRVKPYDANAAAYPHFYGGTTLTVAITRTTYEAKKSGTVTINFENGSSAVGVLENPFTLYFDNFRASTDNLDPNSTTYYTASSASSIFAANYGGCSMWAGTHNTAADKQYYAYEGIYTLRTCLTAGKTLGALVFRKGMNAGQLQKVFSDSNVVAYSFYMYNPNSFDAYVKFGKVSEYSSSNVDFARDSTGATKLAAGQWTKVTLTRETYEACLETKDNNILLMRIVMENSQSSIKYFSLDSFQIEYS